MDIWSDNDGGPTYEAYGEIKVNIGNYDVNQITIMWNVESSNYLDILNGASHFVSHSHTFMESEAFAHVGNITAHGTVWESDTGPDDNVGTPDGDVFQMDEILNQNITRHYPGYGAAYIEISLKIIKL